MESRNAEMADFYRRYLARCNEHRFEELGEFVDEDVRVNDAQAGLNGYGAGLRDVADAFPDFRWELRRLVVDGDWLAARLDNTGTHTGTFDGFAGTGRLVRVRELAMYRLAGGKIVESWGDLGSVLYEALDHAD